MARESTKKSKSASTAKELSERVRELLRKFVTLTVPELKKYAEDRFIRIPRQAEHEKLCLHIAKWQELQEEDPTNYRLAPAPASSSRRFKTPPPVAGPAIIPTYPDCKENPLDTRRYPMRQQTSKEYQNAYVENGFFNDNGPESTPEPNKPHGQEPFAEPQAQALTVQMLREVFERNDAMAKEIDELNELAESLKRKAAAIKQSVLAQRGGRQRMMPFFAYYRQEQPIFASDVVVPPGDPISVAVENDEVEKLAALRRSKEKGKGKAKATDEDEDEDRDEDRDEDDFRSHSSDDGCDSDDDDKPPFDFWPSKVPISRAESGSKSAKPSGSNTTTTRPREDDVAPVAPQAHDAPLPDAPQERPDAAPPAAPQAHDAPRPDSPQEMPESFKKTSLKRTATFLDVRDADNDDETLQPAAPLAGPSGSPQAGPSRPRPAKRARLSPPPAEETRQTASGRTLSTYYPDPAGRTSTSLIHSPEEDSLFSSPRRDGRFVDPNDVLPNGIEANISQRVPRSSRRGGAGARQQRRAPTPFPDASNTEAGPSRPRSTRPSRVRRDGIFALLANQGTAAFDEEEEDGHSASDEDALGGPRGIVPRTQAPAPAPAPAPAEGSGVPQERKARRRVRKPEHK